MPLYHKYPPTCLCIRNSHKRFGKDTSLITNLNDKLLSGKNYARYAIYWGNDFEWHSLLDPLTLFPLSDQSFLIAVDPVYIKYQLIVQSQFIL